MARKHRMAMIVMTTMFSLFCYARFSYKTSPSPPRFPSLGAGAFAQLPATIFYWLFAGFSLQFWCYCWNTKKRKQNVEGLVVKINEVS